MKLSLAVVASLYLTAQAATTQAATDPAKRPESSNEICPPIRSQVPFYRAYHPRLVDHFYTTNQTEWQNILGLGYTHEGIAGYIFASEEASTVPLLRLFNPARIDHFYTTKEAEAIYAVSIGWVREGVAGYIFDRQVCGSQPLFRLGNTANVDNFYTANWEERVNFINYLKYEDWGVTGYVIG